MVKKKKKEKDITPEQQEEEERRKSLARQGKLERVTPELSKQRKSEAKADVRGTEKLASKSGISSKAAREQLAPQRDVELQQQQVEQRAEQQAANLPGQELIAGIDEKLLNPSVDLQPTPIGEGVGGDIAQSVGESTLEATLPEPVSKLLKENLPPEVLEKIGLGTGAAAAAAGIVLAATAATTAGVVSGAATFTKGIGGTLLGLGTYVGVNKLTDINGGKLNILRGQVSAVPEEATKVLENYREDVNMDAEVAVTLLTEMSNKIDASEIRMKELSIYNLDYRNSEEYLLDVEKIASARLDIAGKMRGVQKLFLTR